MTIAVIGANGRTGRVFVELALRKGHKIRAGYYSHNEFKDQPGLTMVECDATKKEDMINLIKGSDAVVSLIGHVKGSPADVQTMSISNAVTAMKALGIKRIVSLTGTGVRLDGDKITLADRFLNLGVRIVDPKRVKDGLEHFKVLRESGLDWTVIRVLKLQNLKPAKFQLREHGPTKVVVSRKEAAEAILMVLVDGAFIKAAPIISKA